jgi:hypothetical protein
VVVPAPEVAPVESVGVGFVPAPPEDCWEPEPVGVGETWATGAVEPPVAGLTVVRGAVGVVGATEWWFCTCPAGGDHTTTFSGGGVAEREPIDGRCTVPESRSSAIAAAPRSRGVSGAATRRAITQIARPLPRSSTDTGLLPLPPWAIPDPGSEIAGNRIGRQPGCGGYVGCFRPNCERHAARLRGSGRGTTLRA